MARRRALASAPALLAGLALCSACGAVNAVRPDLVLLTVSGEATRLLRCDEPDAAPEPLGCQLAEQGAHYAQAFAAASEAAPALASILTSLPARGHGVARSAATFLRSDVETLAERLQRAGYASAAFTPRQRLNRSRHLDQGFDLYWVATAQHAAGDPIRAALAWASERGEEFETPWFVWIDLQAEPGAQAEAALGTWLSAAPQGRRPPGLIAVGLPDETPRTFGDAAPASADASNAEVETLPAELHPDRVRVPLVWVPPGGLPALRVGEAVSSLDIAPSLLRAAAIDPPPDFEGQRLPTGQRPRGAPEARALLISGRDAAAIALGGRFYARRADATVAFTASLDAAGGAALTRVEVGGDATDPLERRLVEAAGWPVPFGPSPAAPDPRTRSDGPPGPKTENSFSKGTKLPSEGANFP